MLPNNGIAHPEQLAILTAAFQEYCQAAHIEPGTPAYEDASRLVMILFGVGISDAAELARLLRTSYGGIH